MNKIIMPMGGQTTDESVLVKWHKNAGDKVKRGDTLFDIETDKATMSVESFCDGYLLNVKYNEGDTVSAGETVAYIGNPGESSGEAAGMETANEDHTEYPLDFKADVKKSEPIISATARISSPLAKKIAREHNINISDIFASTGIVKKQDVLEYMKKSSAPVFEEHCSSGTLQFNVSVDVDMTDCILYCNKLNDFLSGRVRVGYTDFLAKAISKAVKKIPIATLGCKDIDIGIAAGVENRLSVTLLKSADVKSLVQIAEENEMNKQKVKEGAMAGDDITGGIVTIYNFGTLGVNSFYKTLLQSENCVLAMGAISEKAVSINQKILSRDMMCITASFDCRTIDGTAGAQFLSAIKKLLECPELLLI